MVVLLLILSLPLAFPPVSADDVGTGRPGAPPVPGDQPAALPPAISNVRVHSDQTSLRVTWETDLPANGAVRYGTTAAYEGGAVGHEDLRREHVLVIPDLEAQTTYHIQVVSAAGPGPIRQESVQEITISTGLAALNGGPIITVWHGLDQTVGALGMAQRWVNILGNAQAPGGLASMSFTLNGGPSRPLSVGPDNRRLAMPGDFNVEIDWADLAPGENVVAITAVDTLDTANTIQVTVRNEVPMPIPSPRTPTWPLPYSIDWRTVTDLQDVAQVIDGHWMVNQAAGTVRPALANEFTYDRLLGIGDMDWQDYEVTVPITIHRFDGQDPGVGILTRWRGHGVDAHQPHVAYPLGGLGWYRYGPYTGYPAKRIDGNSVIIAMDRGGQQLEIGVTYMFKMRVWTEGVRQWYMLKVWEAGDPEPVEWDLSGYEDIPADAYGSPVLLAHRTDASFGAVHITPLPADEGMVLSNIQVATTETTATITWRSSLPGFGRVDYGLTPGHELGEMQGGVSGTDHTIIIPDLSPDTLYHMAVTTTPSGGGSPASSADRTFRTVGPPAPSSLRSDDFNACRIDPEVWTWIDPYNDSSAGVRDAFLGDARLEIAVPGIRDHRIWTAGVNAPRLMQAANDTDFEIEVKFGSVLTERFQRQGVLVLHQEPDPGAPDDWVHVELYSNGASILAAATIAPNNRPLVVIDNVVAENGTAPLYLRVTRVGDTWTVAHSLDGSTWTTEAPFDFSLPVTHVGVTASNHGSPRPAVTVSVDYIQNTAMPITGEDTVGLTLQVSKVGEGTVQVSPDREVYSCGEGVTLTASPAAEWVFVGWSGDLSSPSSTLSVEMHRPLRLTASFAPRTYTLTTLVAGEGTVATDPPGPAYHLDDVITLTATPAAGWTFSHWTGDATGSSNPTTITLRGDSQVTAVFVEDYTLDTRVVGMGSVARNPDRATYPPGTAVTLTAVPAAGWAFAGWSGGLTSGENLVTITMGAHTTITATFVQVAGHTLSTRTVGNGVVTVSPQKGAYQNGERVTLTATPAAGWVLAGWSGDLTGMDNPVDIVLTRSMVVTATFVPAASTQLALPLVVK